MMVSSFFFLLLIISHEELELSSHKSNAFHMLESFIAYIENQFHTHVQIFRSGNGKEFGDTHATSYYQQKGIIHQTSCVDTP